MHSGGLALTGVGASHLMEEQITAFFASRQCTGAAIRAAMDWALQQARAKAVVVSGFHSPLEQSVLKVLLEAQSPVVAVLARPVEEARLPPEWTEPVGQGRMAVVSAATASARLTHELAAERNEHAAQLATNIVVAYASRGGSLAAQCERWRLAGRPVKILMDAS